jgi:hypothetical protein
MEHLPSCVHIDALSLTSHLHVSSVGSEPKLPSLHSASSTPLLSAFCFEHFSFSPQVRGLRSGVSSLASPSGSTTPGLEPYQLPPLSTINSSSRVASGGLNVMRAAPFEVQGSRLDVPTLIPSPAREAGPLTLSKPVHEW